MGDTAKSPVPRLPGTEDQRTTIYDLQKIIERCFLECEEAKYIRRRTVMSSDPNTENSVEFVLVSRTEVEKHISMTVIGELMELEMIRKLSPIFRGVARLAEEFQYLDDRGRVAQQMAGLRIPTEREEPPSGTQGQEGKEEQA